MIMDCGSLFSIRQLMGNKCYTDQFSLTKITCPTCPADTTCNQFHYILSKKLLGEIKARLHSTLNIEVHLLYSARKDQGAASKFREACDGKSNTILIVQNEARAVFGGFTNCTWTKSDILTYEADASLSQGRHSSFLFKINNEKIVFFDLKPSEAHHAMLNDFRFGPIFGNHDIHIGDESIRSRNSWCNLGHSYESGNWLMGSDKANQYLGNRKMFSIIEYEIWQVSLRN